MNPDCSTCACKCRLASTITKPGLACTEDEIRAFCRENIAHYKMPRYIRFVDELPITVTGKPQKFVMRELMMRELGLSVMVTA